MKKCYYFVINGHLTDRALEETLKVDAVNEILEFRGIHIQFRVWDYYGTSFDSSNYDWI